MEKTILELDYFEIQLSWPGPPSAKNEEWYAPKLHTFER